MTVNRKIYVVGALLLLLGINSFAQSKSNSWYKPGLLSVGGSFLYLKPNDDIILATILSDVDEHSRNIQYVHFNQNRNLGFEVYLSHLFPKSGILAKIKLFHYRQFQGSRDSFKPAEEKLIAFGFGKPFLDKQVVLLELLNLKSGLAFTNDIIDLSLGGAAAFKAVKLKLDINLRYAKIDRNVSEYLNESESSKSEKCKKNCVNSANKHSYFQGLGPGITANISYPITQALNLNGKAGFYTLLGKYTVKNMINYDSYFNYLDEAFNHSNDFYTHNHKMLPSIDMDVNMGYRMKRAGLALKAGYRFMYYFSLPFKDDFSLQGPYLKLEIR